MDGLLVQRISFEPGIRKVGGGAEYPGAGVVDIGELVAVEPDAEQGLLDEVFGGVFGAGELGEEGIEKAAVEVVEFTEGVFVAFGNAFKKDLLVSMVGCGHILHPKKGKKGEK